MGENMEYFGAMLVTGAIGVGFIFTLRSEGRGARCPACAHTGSGITEEARAHKGPGEADRRWLARSRTHSTYRCQRCGHAWTEER